MEGKNQNPKPTWYDSNPQSDSSKDDSLLFKKLFKFKLSVWRKTQIENKEAAGSSFEVGWSQKAAKYFAEEVKRSRLVTKYFAKEGETIDLSFKDLWSVSNDNAFLEDPILDALLYHN